jgi:hypothetical protein
VSYLTNTAAGLAALSVLRANAEPTQQPRVKIPTPPPKEYKQGPETRQQRRYRERKAAKAAAKAART